MVGEAKPPAAHATELFIEWKSPRNSEFCRGRQLGDPLARSALGFPRGCRRAQRIFQNHDCQWQSFQNQKAAERSEADEGWRWLKVIDCLVKWWKLKHIPFIGLHSFTKLSPPLIRLFCQSVLKCRLSKNPASPRGKPRTQKTLVYTIQQAALLCGLRVAKLPTPTMAVQNYGFVQFI